MLSALSGASGPISNSTISGNVAVGIGVSGVDTRTRLKMGVAFGCFEAAMPILGLLAGRSVAGHLGSVGRYAGAALLMLG